MAKAAMKRNTSVLYKFSPWRYGPAEKGLRDINPRVVKMYRRNMLDLYVCKIRDCVDKGFQKSHQKKRSYPIDVSTGEETDLCFKRRKKKDVTVKAFINVETLAARFQVLNEKDLKNDAKAREIFEWNSEAVANEDLFRFENSNSTDALDLSLQSWIEVFHAWGITPDVPLLRQYIVEHPDHGTRPLRPHTESVYNAEEVKNALETRPELKEYLQYWRD
jgi:hypothetical protein